MDNEVSKRVSNMLQSRARTRVGREHMIKLAMLRNGIEDSEYKKQSNLSNHNEDSQLRPEDVPALDTLADFEDVIQKGMNGEVRLFFEAFPLNITNSCNLNCIWCFWREDESFSEGNLSLGDFKKIMHLNAGLNAHFDTINLCSGGEVFKNRDLLEMLRYIKHHFKNKRLWFVTNATYAPTGQAKECYEMLDRITISLDGASKEVYEAIRRPAKFESILRNIRSIVDLCKNADVQIAMTVSQINIHEMKDVVKLASELNHVDFVWVQPAVITNEKIISRIGEQNITKMPKEQVVHHIELAKKVSKELQMPFYTANIETMFENQRDNEYGCLSPWTRGPFSLDTYVMPCSFMDISQKNRETIKKRYNLASPQEKSLEEIYNSEGFWSFRQDLLRGKAKDLCGDCMYANAFVKNDIRFLKSSD